MCKATYTVSLQRARLDIMGAATKDGVLPVEGDQHVSFLSAIIYKLLVSHLGRFFNDTCRLWCFCNQYFLRTSGRLDGKQPGPSLLPAGYRFVLKHCSEAVGMTVQCPPIRRSRQGSADEPASGQRSHPPPAQAYLMREMRLMWASQQPPRANL